MKKLLFIMLFLAGNCLWALAQPAANDTGKKDTSKGALVLNKGNSGANAQGGPQNGAGTGGANAQADPHNSAGTGNAAVPTPAKPSCSLPSPHREIAGWTLIILIIVLFIGVAWKSDLLRDSIANPANFLQLAQSTKYANVSINDIPKPFSLARTQLAVWTVVISCTYIYLDLITNFSLTDIGINTTILTLMGISAGTTAVSSVMDNSNPAQQGVQYPSDNFLVDILSDQNGVNLHRFQNVIWTVIAMTLFLSKVRYMGCGELPTLDATLIALTGISSATYLGLKVNENNKPAIPPTPPAAGPVVPPVPPVPPVLPPVPPVVPPNPGAGV